MVSWSWSLGVVSLTTKESQLHLYVLDLIFPFLSKSDSIPEQYIILIEKASCKFKQYWNGETLTKTGHATATFNSILPHQEIIIHTYCSWWRFLQNPYCLDFENQTEARPTIAIINICELTHSEDGMKGDAMWICHKIPCLNTWSGSENNPEMAETA